MTLKIISTTEVLYEGDADSVTLPGAQGSFTVLNNHASLISTLTSGNIVFSGPQGEAFFPIKGGVADVDSNVISVCVY